MFDDLIVKNNFSDFAEELATLHNCQAYEGAKDDHYDGCIKFLPNDSDICEYLRDVHLAFTYPYYFLGVIPFIFSIFALLINIIFIWITVLIVKYNPNHYRNTYIFLLNRSISTIIAQLLFYIVLIAWKSESFEYPSTVIFLTLGSLSFLTLAGTYVILSIKIYWEITRKKQFLTILKCVIFIIGVWIYNIIFSVFIGIYGSTLIYPEEPHIKCKYDNCQRPLAISITVLLATSYFTVLIAYFASFFKIKHFTRNLKDGKVEQINTQNIVMLNRLLYNIIVFGITKIPLLVICGFTLYHLGNLKNLGNGNETACKKFLHGKLYFQVELLASIAILVILTGMIIDPIIIINLVIPLPLTVTLSSSPIFGINFLVLIAEAKAFRICLQNKNQRKLADINEEQQKSMALKDKFDQTSDYIYPLEGQNCT